MITFFHYGRLLGLPDLSPFVIKTEVLLRMAQIPYQLDSKGYAKAPKGKLPYISDRGHVVADSTLIRRYLENEHGANFDGGYGAVELATAWAVEKMLEEHYYFIALHNRWLIDENFAAGPAKFFETVPAMFRPMICKLVRSKVRKTLHLQGMGRHAQADLDDFAKRDLHAVSLLLGDKRYLLGDDPCGADATVFAFVTGTLCPAFRSEARSHAQSLPNLVAYRDRMMARYFPDL